MLLALLYLVITASFYGTLSTLAPSLDTESPAIRAAIQPLNPPPPDTDPATAAAIDQASADAFALAMLIDAALLAAGAAVNAVGLRRGPIAQRRPGSSAQPSG